MITAGGAVLVAASGAIRCLAITIPQVELDRAAEWGISLSASGDPATHHESSPLAFGWKTDWIAPCLLQIRKQMTRRAIA